MSMGLIWFIAGLQCLTGSLIVGGLSGEVATVAKIQQRLDVIENAKQEVLAK